MEKNMKKNVYMYNLVTLQYSRGWHNTVNQLYFNYICIKKRSSKSDEEIPNTTPPPKPNQTKQSSNKVHSFYMRKQNDSWEQMHGVCSQEGTGERSSLSKNKAYTEATP